VKLTLRECQSSLDICVLKSMSFIANDEVQRFDDLQRCNMALCLLHGKRLSYGISPVIECTWVYDMIKRSDLPVLKSSRLPPTLFVSPITMTSNLFAPNHLTISCAQF